MQRFTDSVISFQRSIANDYYPLENAVDLDPLIERIGESKFVLLGEASHGTHEYYTWRTAITKRLIQEKGFSFIAVEGDWPDCFMLNKYIKGYMETGESAKEILKKFNRWPTWMWSNWEIVSLVEWLKKHNDPLPQEKKIGFYGLDVYSLWESMEVIANYLQKEDPASAEIAVKVLHCFHPYQSEAEKYAEAVLKMLTTCEKEIVQLLKKIRKHRYDYGGEPESWLNAEMNALVTSNAEKYYRSLFSLREDSWNIRDKHMMATLQGLKDYHGSDSKVIIWEHNTHIGDARATSMTKEGLLNVGQLVRELYEEDGVVLVGFGSYMGKVIAGHRWGAQMEEMVVPPAKEGSIEEILHQESDRNKLLIFKNKPKLIKKFDNWIGHRAIGVVYHPHQESGNYVPTKLSSRYDAFLYLDRTSALHPLNVSVNCNIVPNTFPFNV